MLRVGLTGGIGSGKTTVAKIWDRLGAVVVYADELAKKLMQTDKDLICRIRSTFGDASYNDDGSLNRAYLSSQAFESGRVEELNRIVHPAVFNKTEELMRDAEAKNIAVFVKEAALLLINGRPENLDIVVLVTAPEEMRIRRVSDRDSSEPEEVRRRIRSQQKDDELVPMSDYIIHNDKDLLHLEEEAVRIFSLITAV
jgi:dephospho-CoA kinase